MTIFAHDEDSMTNLFFSEVYRHGKVESFLSLIKWLDYSKIPFSISHTELHQQVNFSEFGKPDVLIVVTDESGQKHIVIVEVKLGRYLECCIANQNGIFNNKFNSRLNNQLILRYRAMKSLSSIEREGFITESKHSLESPYSNDQIRRCKKPSTINLFENIAKEKFQFYLVALTSDLESPFNNMDRSSNLFPLFFDKESGDMKDFKNLGSIVWNQCHQLLIDVDNHFSNSSFLHFSTESKDDDLPESPPIRDLFVKGRQIIIFNGEKCHLSCKGYSYAIRHFSNGRFVEKDRGKNDKVKYLALKNQIQVLEKAPYEPIGNTAYWENYFRTESKDDDLPESPPIRDLFVKGRQIIIFNGEKCHLSCKGYSYAIRHFSNGRFVEKDRGKNDKVKYLALKNQIQVLEKAPYEPIGNTAYWENYFRTESKDDDLPESPPIGNLLKRIVARMIR